MSRALQVAKVLGKLIAIRRLQIDVIPATFYYATTCLLLLCIRNSRIAKRANICIYCWPLNEL